MTPNSQHSFEPSPKVEEIEGEKVFFYKEVSSTMDVAEELAKEGGCGIILAESQISGKGRYGKKWISPEGGLYLSWVIKDKKELQKYILEISVLALVKTLNSFDIKNCKIKFPNDIIINRKKIAGILIEKKSDYTIVGVGVNLNSTGNEIGNYAVSFKELKNKKLEIKKFLKVFILTFKSIYRGFTENSRVYLEEWSNLLIK